MYIYLTVTKYLTFYSLIYFSKLFILDILVKYKFTHAKYSILHFELFERITNAYQM